MTSIYKHIATNEDVTLKLNSDSGKGYQLAFYLDDDTLWVRNITVELTEYFVQRDISSFTADQAYTIMPAQIQNTNGTLLVMVDRRHEIVKEITFKSNNPSRKLFFEHLKASINE